MDYKNINKKVNEKFDKIEIIGHIIINILFLIFIGIVFFIINNLIMRLCLLEIFIFILGSTLKYFDNTKRIGEITFTISILFAVIILFLYVCNVSIKQSNVLLLIVSVLLCIGTVYFIIKKLIDILKKKGEENEK